MIYSVKAKKSNPTDSTYKDRQTLQFSIKLPANQYINQNSVHKLLTKIKSSTNEAIDIATNMITMNNFFAHWIKEIDTKRYGDDLQILQVNNPKIFIGIWAQF